MRDRRHAIAWRAVLAAAIVSVSGAVFSDFHWTLFDTKKYDPVTRAHPEFVSVPVAAVTAPIAEVTWWICPALPELLVAVVASIGVFVLLGGNRCGSRETRCRHCRAVLRALTEARCPACGEPL